MINGISSNSSFEKVVVSGVDDALSAPLTIKRTAVIDAPASGSKISTLARQLSESASRAEIRNANLDRRQLGVEAERLLSQILGDVYQADKASHNTEVPRTIDPDLLDRARQATDYIVRSDKHDRNVKNPFISLSRDQLNLIVYDESGLYTVNERRAAWYGVSDIEAKWNRKLMCDENLESAMNGGRTPMFYAEVMAHYKTLPLIEQVQYPDNYEAKLLVRIDEASNPLKRKEPKFLTLFEMLEIMLKRKKIVSTEKDGRSSGGGSAISNACAVTASGTSAGQANGTNGSS